MRMDNGQAYRQAAQVLPLPLRGVALDLPEDKQGRAEELRLRIGHPVTVVFPQGELSLGTNPVTGWDLEHLLELASRASALDVSLRSVFRLYAPDYIRMVGGDATKADELAAEFDKHLDAALTEYSRPMDFKVEYVPDATTPEAPDLQGESDGESDDAD